MSAVKLTELPAATETVLVLLPSAPPTLQRRSLEARSVTGELLFVFCLMFWYAPPLTPLAVRYSKMSVEMGVSDEFVILQMGLHPQGASYSVR